MVRNYVRKTNRASYGAHRLQEALTAIKDGKVTKRKASIVYGIPRSTLVKYSKKPDNVSINLGRFRPVFDERFEAEIVMHVVQMQHRFYGMSIMDLRSLAYQLAEVNNIAHPFQKTTRLAGRDWAKDFLRRYPELTLRRPEATSLSRLTGFNRVQVGKFYDLLHAELTAKKFKAEQIYNIDESSITTVQSPGRIIACKGSKQVGRVVSGERGATTTVVCAMSAAGRFIPPVFLFKRKKMNDRLMKNCPPGAIGLPSHSGWMDCQLFLRYMQHFIKCAQPSEKNPLLVIFDGHQSHKSIEAVELARANYITLLTIPPHTSHRIQPLDLTFFAPLKTAYNRACDAWMVGNPGKRITDYELSENFAKAYTRVATAEKAISAFRASGIFPFDRDIFSDEDFAPSSVTEQPLQEVGQQIQKTQGEAIASEGKKSGANQKENELTPGTPQQPTAQTVISAKSRRVSVLEISPYPQVAQSGNRKRKAEVSTVLTSTPNKRRLEEIRAAKQAKSEKLGQKQLDVKKFHVKGSKRSTAKNLQAARKPIHGKNTSQRLESINKETGKHKGQIKRKLFGIEKSAVASSNRQNSAGGKELHKKSAPMRRPLPVSKRPPLPRQPIWLEKQKCHRRHRDTSKLEVPVVLPYVEEPVLQPDTPDQEEPVAVAVTPELDALKVPVTQSETLELEQPVTLSESPELEEPNEPITQPDTPELQKQVDMPGVEQPVTEPDAPELEEDPPSLTDTLECGEPKEPMTQPGMPNLEEPLAVVDTPELDALKVPVTQTEMLELEQPVTLSESPELEEPNEPITQPDTLEFKKQVVMPDLEQPVTEPDAQELDKDPPTLTDTLECEEPKELMTQPGVPNLEEPVAVVDMPELNALKESETLLSQLTTRRFYGRQTSRPRHAPCRFRDYM